MLAAIGVFRGETRARRSAGTLVMIAGVQGDVSQGDPYRWRNFRVDNEHRPMDGYLIAKCACTV